MSSICKMTTFLIVLFHPPLIIMTNEYTFESVNMSGIYAVTIHINNALSGSFDINFTYGNLYTFLYNYNIDVVDDNNRIKIINKSDNKYYITLKQLDKIIAISLEPKTIDQTPIRLNVNSLFGSQDSCATPIENEIINETDYTQVSYNSPLYDSLFYFRNLGTETKKINISFSNESATFLKSETIEQNYSLTYSPNSIKFCLSENLCPTIDTSICDDATYQTGCITLNGTFDLEINESLVLAKASARTIETYLNNLPDFDTLSCIDTSDWVLNPSVSVKNGIATYTASKKDLEGIYNSSAALDLSTAIVRSLKNSDMRKWQAVKDALTSLTGKTDWVVDTDNNRFIYTTSASTGVVDSSDRFGFTHNSFNGVLYKSVKGACMLYAPNAVNYYIDGQNCQAWDAGNESIIAAVAFSKVDNPNYINDKLWTHLLDLIDYDSPMDACIAYAAFTNHYFVDLHVNEDNSGAVCYISAESNLINPYYVDLAALDKYDPKSKYTYRRLGGYATVCGRRHDVINEESLATDAMSCYNYLGFAGAVQFVGNVDGTIEVNIAGTNGVDHALYQQLPNPYYNLNGEIESYVSFEDVALKIIANTSSSNQGTSLLAQAYLENMAKSIFNEYMFVLFTDIAPKLEQNKVLKLYSENLAKFSIKNKSESNQRLKLIAQNGSTVVLPDLVYNPSLFLYENILSFCLIPEVSHKVIDLFDYAVVRYLWTAESGKDLDTRTSVIVPFRGLDVGWGQLPYDEDYLDWVGDNVDYGTEAVLINVTALKAAYPKENVFSFLFKAFWFSIRGNGNVTLEIITYLGGEMIKTGDFNFINSGGERVQTLILNSNITQQGSSNLPGEAFAQLSIDIQKQTGSLSPTDKTYTSLRILNSEGTTIFNNHLNQLTLLDNKGSVLFNGSTQQHLILRNTANTTLFEI